MKKLVFASVMALASISLVSAPMLRAQDSRSPSRIRQSSTPIKWPHTDRSKAKAAALESFLKTYPQSVVKSAVLDTLIDTYQRPARCRQDAQRGQPPASGGSQQHEGHLHLGLHQEGQCAKTVDPKTG